MQNKDNECFKLAVTRALHPVSKNSARVTDELRSQAEKYNWSNVKFPMEVKNIGKCEKANNIGVNVFGYDEDKEKLLTVKVCDQEIYPSMIVNLYLHDDLHYYVITDPSRFASTQLN